MRCLVAIAFVMSCCSSRVDEAANPTNFRQEITNSLGMPFKLIPAGTHHKGEKEREIIIEQPFYLGFTEVTNAQGIALMGFTPSHFKDPRLPIQSITYYEAVAFCNKLSSLQAERIAGRVYRLPTKDEWKHACRAGTTTKYSFGNDDSLLGQFAWYTKNTRRPQVVIGKQPNPWGLFGMHGNVAEWCKEMGIVLGGQWNKKAVGCTSGSMYAKKPETKDWAIGFRLAITPPGVTSQKSEE